MRLNTKPSLPAFAELLTSGGDGRIIRDAQGMNKYGCFATPQPDILSYGSSTASTISASGYDAALRLYERFEPGSYAREMSRVRKELLALCGLNALAPDIIFAASGTDIHLFAAQLLGKAASSLRIIMPDASETGSGVPAALRGQHFSHCTALGGAVTAGVAMDHGQAMDIAAIKSRFDHGELHPAADVDAEIEAQAVRAIESGQHVLLVLADVSKTGLMIPSVACALGLKRRFPEQLDILVDACQWRLSPATLRAYLEQNVMLAITGSKFATGPAFSAALLVPEAIAQRLRHVALSPALGLYSARADWPDSWAAGSALPDTENTGLLLRWEAALATLRVFQALPETAIEACIETFAAAVQQRLKNDPAFAPLPAEAIDRSALLQEKTWDRFPTIFPFLLRHPTSGTLLHKEEMTRIYEQLTAARCQLGQPVACGALRLCLDMRLIVEALSAEGGMEAVIAGAMRALDQAAKFALPTG